MLIDDDSGGDFSERVMRLVAGRQVCGNTLALHQGKRKLAPDAEPREVRQARTAAYRAALVARDAATLHTPAAAREAHAQLAAAVAALLGSSASNVAGPQ